MNQKVFRLHIICAGNIYRSRLAEAYIKSIQIPGLVVSSSGTKASSQNKGSITWYAQRLLQRNGLTPFMSSYWRDTDSCTLRSSDYVVFIGKRNYEFCISNKYYVPEKYEIWKLPDFDDSNLPKDFIDKENELKLIEESQRTFSEIKRRSDELLKRLFGDVY